MSGSNSINSYKLYHDDGNDRRAFNILHCHGFDLDELEASQLAELLLEDIEECWIEGEPHSFYLVYTYSDMVEGTRMFNTNAIEFIETDQKQMDLITGEVCRGDVKLIDGKMVETHEI